MRKETDLAYIAGFLDGEGSISITRNSKNGQLLLRVCIVQTQKEVLEWIQAVMGVGGTLYKRSRNGSLGNKPCYVVCWAAANAARVLEFVEPYLKVKRLQAETALEFQKTMGGCGVRVTEAVKQRREDFRNQLQLINGG